MNFYLVTMIKLGLVAFVFLTALAYLQWIERKVIAHVQLRVGPNRVGPHGLLQPLTDTIKLLTKEDLLPGHVNKFFYFIAPILSVSCALVGISVIPFGPKINVFGVETYMQLTDLNIGVLVLLAASGLGVYGVALAGWASNNKYSLLGGLRASAQMISYELPLSLAIAIPLLVYNSLSMREIVEAQNRFQFGFIPAWGIFQFPYAPFLFIAFIIFLIGAFAETNRIPFDLPEAENELVAGFHTEYASMKFAAFFMAEYANMVNICCLATHLFLGGWVPLFPAPYSDFVPVALFVASGAMMIFHGLNPRIKMDGYTLPAFGVVFIGLGLAHMAPVLKDILVPLFWFLAKAGFLLFLYIWVRATLPRFRYDQLMDFAWIQMFPASLACLFAVGFIVAWWGL
ncbi:MAG: NADH-quinone oxidoreductase subunit H [Acidobacteria bacterium]|nr:NADH-quinone oxidoreductase subunit H [Acidobacteriota bacterium]